MEETGIDIGNPYPFPGVKPIKNQYFPHVLNGYQVLYLKNQNTITMKILAQIKSLFIALTDYFGAVFTPVYLFLPGLFFLMAYYLIIVLMPIGQDMLMHTSENKGAFICTNISIFIWMLFAWLSSRLVADEFQNKKKPANLKPYRHLPRIIAYNIPVGLQLAALNLPTIGFSRVSTWVFVLLWVLHNAFYFLLNYAFFHKLNTKKVMKKAYALIYFSAISYIVFVIYIFMNETRHVSFFKFNENQHVWVWMLTIIFYFIVQVYFVKLTIWNRLHNAAILAPAKLPLWKRWYNILAFLTTVLYFCIVISISFANIFGSLGCVLLAFGIWVGLIYLIKFMAIRYDGRLGLPLLLFAIIVGIFSDPYDVDLPKTDAPQFAARPELDAYLKMWIENEVRREAIQKASVENPYPVYMVIADGGASKSGYWVSSVLSKFEDQTPAKNKFSNHLLSMAGASGGSVGNAVFYSLLRKEHFDHEKVNYTKETRDFFKSDFLTYSLARFLGPDLFRHFIPCIPMDDRASALEAAMEKTPCNPSVGSYFGRNLEDVFDYSGRLPLLFINTTNLDQGVPGVISNVKINPHYSNRMDVLAEVDKATDRKNRHSTIKLSTSVVLGARFPYVSPAGEINGKYFVDGGYFDNSGGGITLELVQYIKERMDETEEDVKKFPDWESRMAVNQVLKKMKFSVIYVSNGIQKHTDVKKRLHPLVNDIAAPLLTVFGTYGQQTNLSNNKLQLYLKKWYKTDTDNPFKSVNLPYTQDDKIPYPMNWVISEYNLNRMEDKNLKLIPLADYIKQ